MNEYYKICVYSPKYYSGSVIAPCTLGFNELKSRALEAIDMKAPRRYEAEAKIFKVGANGKTSAEPTMIVSYLG